MKVTVHFYSYFKDLAGCSALSQDIPPASTLGELTDLLGARFPKLGALRHSMLTAVGLEYQDRAHVLCEGDEVALFPPVQGG